MPRPSAFNSTHFSSKPPHGEKFYREMVKALGSGANFSDDFNSVAMARVYANARALGRAKYAIERAANQFRPSRALELLPALEEEYGLVPVPNDSISTRRAELAVAAWIARGARRSNVTAMLSVLFGADFVRYITISAADAVQSPANPPDAGVYAPPGTARSAWRLLGPVTSITSPVTVQAVCVAGLKEAPYPESRFVVDTGSAGRRESVAVINASVSGETMTLTAQFSRPHDTGTVLAFGRHPQVATSKRHNLFLLTPAAARDNNTRLRLARIAKRLLRAVSTWSVSDGSGPFRVGHGRLGYTTIGEIT